MNKEKSVTFYTKHIFIADHTSSQRSESLNNCLKGFESLKKEMMHWNIFQLMTWLDKCVERIYTEIFLKVKNVLNDALKIVNFGPNGWIIFGMRIVHMLLILIL